MDSRGVIALASSLSTVSKGRVMRIPGWLSDQPSLVGCTVTRQVIEAVVAFQHFPLPVRVTVISVDAGKIPTLEKEADQRQISSL